MALDAVASFPAGRVLDVACDTGRLSAKLPYYKWKTHCRGPFHTPAVA